MRVEVVLGVGVPVGVIVALSDGPFGLAPSAMFNTRAHGSLLT